MQWINSTNLKQWAEGRQKRDVGLMLEKLVLASADVQFGRFLHGENNEARGWDGSLVADSKSQFVPDGRSIWEWGVDTKYFEKAESDFQARTFGRPKRGTKKADESTDAETEPSDIGDTDSNVAAKNEDANAVNSAVQPDLTFVFVTPFVWNKVGKNSLDQWVIDKRSSGNWKDVRIIDGQQLERWLAQEPAVAKSLAKEMGLIPDTDVFSVDEYWEMFSCRYKWPLAEEVILAGRESQRNSLLQALSADNGTVVVSADSQEEAVAFAVAAIRKAEDGVRERMLARTVVLETETAGHRLPVGPNRVVITKRSACQIADYLSVKWPTVLPAGRAQRIHDTTIKLPLPSRTQFSDALISMGVDSTEAEKIARRANRSVTILLRQEFESQPPIAAWASLPREELIPPFLAGGWNSGNEHDQRMVCQLAGVDPKDYHRLEATVRQHAMMEDAPWDVQRDLVLVRAPVDAFLQSGYLLTAADLDRLKAVAIEVFSEIDPQLSASSDDLTRYDFKHSSDLRDGLAQTLLVIAILHHQIGLNIANLEPARFVEDLISQLPGLSSNERLIASLDDQFPLLLEAAPGPLLAALEQQLKGNDKLAATIFREYGFLGTGSFHTGLLWGLERLAWAQRYLRRVANVLFLLAEVDPGGKLSNRPVNTLREIFLPWHPGTMAASTYRHRVLAQLVQEYPRTGWKLLLELLPESQGVSTPTAQPQYRDFSTTRPQIREVRESYQEIAKLALSFAEQNPALWIDLVSNLPRLPPDARHQAIEALKVGSDELTSEQKKALWEQLRTLVAKHRRFSKANWALPEPELRALENVTEMLVPTEPSSKWGWLFNEHFPDLEDDLELSSKELMGGIEQRRQQVVGEIFAAGGQEAVLDFAQAVSLPYFVGLAYGQVAGWEEQKRLLQNLIKEKQSEAIRNLILGISTAEYKLDTIRWLSFLKELHENTSKDDQAFAAALVGIPSVPETWKYVEQFGRAIVDHYWQYAFPERTDNIGTLIAGAEHLLAAGRTLAAVSLVYDNAEELPAEFIADLLDRAIPDINAQAAKGDRVSAYQIEQLFLGLRQVSTDLQAVGVLELRYLPLLGEDNVTGLHKLIATDPALLIQIIGNVYQSTLLESSKPSGEAAEKLATSSFKILMAIGKVAQHFGADESGPSLSEWVRSVRALAAKEGYVDIADIYVGKVLAHTAENEQWPPAAVAEIIEEEAAEKILSGVRTELFNKRGTYGKGIYDGGSQERELAERFERRAQEVAEHHLTASLLMDLAESYRRDAADEDVRAEQRKLRDR